MLARVIISVTHYEGTQLNWSVLTPGAGLFLTLCFSLPYLLRMQPQRIRQVARSLSLCVLKNLSVISLAVRRAANIWGHGLQLGNVEPGVQWSHAIINHEVLLVETLLDILYVMLVHRVVISAVLLVNCRLPPLRLIVATKSTATTSDCTMHMGNHITNVCLLFRGNNMTVFMTIAIIEPCEN